MPRKKIDVIDGKLKKFNIMNYYDSSIVILDHVKIISKIFDNLNFSVCSNCKHNCCSNCGANNGHFEKPIFVETLEHLDKIKSLYNFDPKLGFLNPQKGCNLPRVLRSHTCQNHTCRELGLKNSQVIKIRTSNIVIKSIKHFFKFPY